MKREVLDEYLDGALSTAQAAEIAALLESDVNAAELCARMKRERSLRSAAIAGYAPSTEEAESAAVRMIAVLQDEAAAPVGRIGPQSWFKRSLGVAAMLAIVAGGFYAGRVTAPENVKVVDREVVKVDPAKTLYTVVYSGASGEQLSKDFDTAVESQAFVTQLQADARRTTVATADYHVEDHGSW